MISSSKVLYNVLVFLCPSTLMEQLWSEWELQLELKKTSLYMTEIQVHGWICFSEAPEGKLDFTKYQTGTDKFQFNFPFYFCVNFNSCFSYSSKSILIPALIQKPFSKPVKNQETSQRMASWTAVPLITHWNPSKWTLLFRQLFFWFTPHQVIGVWRELTKPTITPKPMRCSQICNFTYVTQMKTQNRQGKCGQSCGCHIITFYNPQWFFHTLWHAFVLWASVFMLTEHDESNPSRCHKQLLNLKLKPTLTDSNTATYSTLDI